MHERSQNSPKTQPSTHVMRRFLLVSSANAFVIKARKPQGSLLHLTHGILCEDLLETPWPSAQARKTGLNMLREPENELFSIVFVRFHPF